jgi:hypothetical protein
MWRLKLEMPEQSNSSLEESSGKYAIKGLAIHLAGFALGFISIGLVLGGVIGTASGITVLAPFADLLYGLGLVIVVAVAARVGVPMRYLIIAGAVIGIGLFYKSAPHEIHIATGIGFGLVHPAHILLGMILVAVSVVTLAVLSIRYSRLQQQGDKN